MKRLSIKNIVVVMILVMSAAAIAAVIWITTTTNGTRWLLRTAVPLSGVSFSAQKIDGTISNGLHDVVKRLTVDVPGILVRPQQSQQRHLQRVTELPRRVITRRGLQAAQRRFDQVRR